MKKLFAVLLLSCMMLTLLFPQVSFAKTGDVIGYANYTDISAYINHYPITSYNINGYTAVVAEDLANYGFDVNWDDYQRALYIESNHRATKITPHETVYQYSAVAGYPSFAYLETDITTYVNGNYVESFNIGGQTCIYMDDLASCGELVWVPEFRAIKLWLGNLPTKDYAPLPEAPISRILSWEIEDGWEAGYRNISWSQLAPGAEYVLTVVEQRNSRYEGDIPPNDPKVYRYVDEYSHTEYLKPNRTYTITLTAYGISLQQSLYVSPVGVEGRWDLQDTMPQTRADAEAIMTKVTVPVWKMRSNGTKYSSTATISIHPAIAERVKLVFEDIYNGAEKFPIKDVGGYSWRGSRSEHNWGTAIDINSNENYCIYNNGTTIGSFWAPYESPYSITPYGDVITAFEKYGFTWGGDSWSNPKDYMHFSFFGT